MSKQDPNSEQHLKNTSRRPLPKPQPGLLNKLLPKLLKDKLMNPVVPAVLGILILAIGIITLSPIIEKDTVSKKASTPWDVDPIGSFEPVKGFDLSALKKRILVQLEKRLNTKLDRKIVRLDLTINGDTILTVPKSINPSKVSESCQEVLSVPSDSPLVAQAVNLQLAAPLKFKAKSGSEAGPAAAPKNPNQIDTTLMSCALPKLLSERLDSTWEREFYHGLKYHDISWPHALMKSQGTKTGSARLAFEKSKAKQIGDTLCKEYTSRHYLDRTSVANLEKSKIVTLKKQNTNFHQGLLKKLQILDRNLLQTDKVVLSQNGLLKDLVEIKTASNKLVVFEKLRCDVLAPKKAVTRK